MPRRLILLMVPLLISTLVAVVPALVAAEKSGEAAASLAALESDFGGRIGVYALDTADGRTLEWRGEERFPMCSTFKVVLVAAILDQAQADPALLERRIHYGADDLVSYSPVTEQHLADGMPVAGLCAAALQHSDNTAANLLLELVDGPEGLTDYARRIGDGAFRLDRIETDLNTAIPGDPRDTTSPHAMVSTLRHLVLGDGLQEPHRQLFSGWMLGNTTGGARIRAGMPPTWIVADKTGSGDYGTANDVGIVWPEGRAPIVIAIYTTRELKGANYSNEAIAEAARIIAQWAVSSAGENR